MDIKDKPMTPYEKAIMQLIENGLIPKTEMEFDTEIKSWGNSAHVPVQKKYAGYKCRVIIYKKEEAPK